MPVRNAAVQGGDCEEQHQRVEGQQVASEQRTAQNAEEDGIDQKQRKNSAQGGRGEGEAGLAVVVDLVRLN